MIIFVRSRPRAFLGVSFTNSGLLLTPMMFV